MTSNRFSRRQLMAALAGGAALGALPHRAFAQQPLPPLIKLVVGYSAGGPVDGAARRRPQGRPRNSRPPA
jgi:tripartite-type tricarboxylate transporter receptor subunit TctC